MKKRAGSEENLAGAAFGAAVETVTNRMPSVGDIRAIIKNMPVSMELENKKSRSYSAMPLAAAMALCLVLPALFADRSESLAAISADAVRNGSLVRCGETALVALSAGSKSLGFGK